MQRSLPATASSPRRVARPRARRHSLRNYLIALVLVVLCPGLSVGVIAGLQARRADREVFEGRLTSTARALSLALDAELETYRAAAESLAASPLLDGADRAAFAAQAREVGAGFGCSVVLLDPDGTTVLDTGARDGTPAHVAPPPALAEIVRTGHSLIGDLVQAGEGWRASVLAPVIRGGSVVSVLAMRIDPGRLTSVLDGVRVSSQTLATLVDGEQRIVARSLAEERFVGRRVPVAADPARGLVIGRLLDGPRVAFGRAYLGIAPAWRVAVAEPLEHYRAAWEQPLLELATGGLVLLLIALALAYRLSRGLLQPLATLAERADAVAAGILFTGPAVLHSPVTEFERLRVSLNAAARALARRSALERSAARAAQRDRDLLKSVVNGTGDMVSVKDPEGRYLLVNRSALGMYGLREENVIGRRDVDFLPHARGEEAMRLDREVIRTGEARSVEETIVVGGELRVCRLVKMPWRGPDGRVSGVLVVGRDITQSRRAEAQLREKQAELLRAARLSTIGTMAAGLAHELNQPLTAATNFLGAAGRMLARLHGTRADLLADARAAVADAAGQTVRAGDIVRRLRNFVGGGDTELRIETVAELVEEACALALPQQARTTVELRIAVDRDAGRALVDRIQIEQVLVNLVRNAAEAMQDAETRRLTVSVARTREDALVFTVADTGPGLSPEMLARIFEPFVSSKSGGMGIGLSVCRTIVEAHGGRIWAEPGPDGGTAIRFLLPPIHATETVDA